MSIKDCKFEDLKRYVGVKFIRFGRSNDVIPKSWICKWTRKSKKCRWPKENFAGLAKTCVDHYVMQVS